MYKVLILIIVNFSFLVGQSDLFSFNIVIENQIDVNNDYHTTKGFYYTYAGIHTSGNSYNFLLSEINYTKAMLILGYLYGKGIKVNEAWYKTGKDLCRGRAFVQYDVLLIRIKEEQSINSMRSFGFSKIEKPSFECSDSFQHISFTIE